MPVCGTLRRAAIIVPPTAIPMPLQVPFTPAGVRLPSDSTWYTTGVFDAGRQRDLQGHEHSGTTTEPESLRRPHAEGNNIQPDAAV